MHEEVIICLSSGAGQCSSIDKRIEQLDQEMADLLRRHEDQVQRLAEVLGLGADSAQQIIAEVGATAATFPSENHLSSWVGACPGSEESAEMNQSGRSPHGNRHMRRILNQAANSAVKHKGSIFEILYRRYVPRLGHQHTIAIIAHKLCRLIWKILHRGMRYEERGREVNKKSKQARAQKMTRELRRLGYRIEPTTQLRQPRPMIFDPRFSTLATDARSKMDNAMVLKFQPLEGHFVRLEPFEPRLKEEVRVAIDDDPEAWAIMPINPTGMGFEEYWATACGAPTGERMAYAIRRLSDKTVVGMSSYYTSLANQHGIEIGTSFVRPDVRGSAVNPESKLLMLSHAFASGAVRVQFRVDTRNVRSQAAVLPKSGVLAALKMQ